MSKINQIQAALKEIDSGKFQKLCDAYLGKNPRYANLQPLGSVIAKDKTRTGIPDSRITLADGTYALAHYTTIDQAKLVGKLKDDLESSFDESKTHTPVDQLAEIVLCHNGYLQPEETLLLTSTLRSETSS